MHLGGRLTFCDGTNHMARHTGRESVQKYGEEMEKTLLAQFDSAYKRQDIGKMHVGNGGGGR